MWDDNKTLGMSKRWHSITQPPAFVGNQNMGNKMEKNNWQNLWMGGLMMGKCKDKQKNSCIIKTTCKHSKGRYGRLTMGNVYTCHGFKKIMHKFEKVNSIKIFHKFNQWFIDKGFNNPWKPAINKKFETLKPILCNSR